MAIEPIYVGTLIGAASGVLTARFFHHADILIMLWSLGGLVAASAPNFFEPASVFSAGLTGMVMCGVALLVHIDHLRAPARQRT